MKLLVPVDGSTASVNAVKKAMEIARKDHYSMKIVSIVDSGHVRDKWHELVDSHLQSEEREEYKDLKLRKENAEKILHAVVTRLDFTGIDVETQVLVGEPYVEILEVANTEKVDLIVIGNRGFSKIKRFFLGSVAQRVISEAPCPVLVIHAEAAY